MDNSEEKPCAAIALDSSLSEEAGYRDDSPAKPISRKKSRKRRHGESTSSRYKIMINHLGVLKELPHKENGNEPLKSVWAGFLFTQEWGVAN